MMRTYPVCGGCVYLTGHRSSVGIECLNPENQARWDRSINHTARYKYVSTKACKKYKAKEIQTDCAWR